MQPLTNKELNYIDDLLGAEELLLKTCVTAAQGVTQADAQQFLHHTISQHQRRYDELVHLVEQHESLARS